MSTVPQGLPLPGHRSVVYVKYHNGATTLASANVDAVSLSSLAGKRVVAFGDAQYIVPGLKEAIPSFKSYKEHTDQLIQNKLLFSKRADVVIGDGLIFSAFNDQLIAQANDGKLRINPSQDVEFKAIFEPTAYTLMFKDAALQADFDRCYAEILESGVLNGINQKYLDMHSKVVTSEYIGL